jgi:hypothetical protein
MTVLWKSPEVIENLALGHFPCGHDRTPENTQAVGSAGVRCRTCRRRLARDWFRAKKSIPASRYRGPYAARLGEPTPARR